MWHHDTSAIKGVLLDIHGVLYNGCDNGGTAIDGSIEALRLLKNAGVNVRFCTNETQKSTKNIALHLNSLGFEINERHIFSPLMAIISVLQKRNLRPYLLIHEDVEEQFQQVDQSSPNCVVIGDAGEKFNYATMTEAFQCLIAMETPLLFSLGIGRYYKQADHFSLDVGPFTKALEYACGIQAEVTGKPCQDFFQEALYDMNLSTDQVIMIGDDIVNDVGGAQKAGIRSLQVRTGKYRPCDEPHQEITPDGYVNNLLEAVRLLVPKSGSGDL